MEKHILFYNDRILSDILDRMIIDVSGDHTVYKSRRALNNLIGPGSWSYDLAKLRSDFLDRLADDDAAETASAFIKVFDSKKQLISSLDENALGQDVKDTILFTLSCQRKAMGLDSKRFKVDTNHVPRLDLAH